MVSHDGQDPQVVSCAATRMKRGVLEHRAHTGAGLVELVVAQATERGGPRRRLHQPEQRAQRRATETRLRAGRDQPALVREDHGLHWVAESELGEQAGDVGLDRALADEQLGGQLGVALTARQHPQHLALALRQGVQPRPELRRGRPACELLDDAPRDRRGEQRLAGSHDVHCMQELLGWGVLEQEAAGARPQRLEHVLVTLERGEDHHTTVQLAVFGNPPRGLESVTVGHLDVHQHDVGPQAPGAGHGLLAVRRLPDNLDLGIGLEDHPEAGANHRLVIGQQHTDAHSTPSEVGSLTRTANPPPDTGPAVSWPPCRAARSRMPINPRPPGLVPDRAITPRPSSTISTSSSSGQYRTRTSARDAAACLRVLVSASCTMRYADTPIIGGNERSSPSTLTTTASSDSLILAASRGSWLRPGCGARSSRSPACRRNPSRRCNSPTACRLETSIAANAPFALTRSLSITTRAAPAWTPIMLTWWATTSCSSRAIRTRSSNTACSACVARDSATSACSARARTARPATQATAKSTGMNTSWSTECPGMLYTRVAAPP